MSTREIKFRYICRNKHFNEIQIEYITLKNLENRKELPTWIFSDNCEILSKDLYTGLKDKNGKEIYEGDIVKYDDGDGWEISREEVKFTNGAFNCACYHPDMKEFVNDPRIIEVIGNIYQTPDLIK